MPRDANFSFLARQLIATELAGAATDTPGGVHVLADGRLWLGLWDVEAAGDPEQLVLHAQSEAKQHGAELAGALLLLAPGEADSAPVTALSEALFVYGYPQAAGPDSVMVLGTPAHPKPDAELRLDSLNASDAAAQLPNLAELLAEQCGPAWGDAASALARLELHGAWRGDQLVAAVGTAGEGLAGRVVLLGADDKPAAHALLERVASSATADGRLVQCAWTTKRGLLRFLLTETGYAEQLVALHFAAE